MSENNKPMNKVILGAVAGIGLIFMANCVAIVDAGHARVKTMFGEVSEDVPLGEGLHFLNPLVSLTEYSLQDQAYELKGISVPSQDKFKSSVDITIMYKFDLDYLNTIRREAGNEDQALNKYMKQKLLSVVREYGKSVPSASDLFKSEVQNGLQVAIQRDLSDYSGKYGIVIGDVFIQDINLDPTIQEQVKQVKIREEMVNAEAAQLLIVEQIAQRDVKAAEARASAAASDRIAAEQKADGVFYAAKKEADGDLYKAQQEA
ncbi:MAG: SPFH domain-containing protein, partial [Plesiomonas sp.]